MSERKKIVVDRSKWRFGGATPNVFVDEVTEKLANLAMWINDDPYFDLAKREEKLIELFAEYGLDLEFVGEPAIKQKAPHDV